MGNIFFSFDGCAQYLSSPTAPYLIAHAYRQNKTPPVLVACIRNPVDQDISWWQYENNAMAWGESMGLTEWNTELRSKQYPPKTIVEALEFSQSTFVQQAYNDAESLVKPMLRTTCTSNDGPENRLLHKTYNWVYTRKTLPPWAITWPGGQLSIIGKGYSCNISRYNEVFQSEFGSSVDHFQHNICDKRKCNRIGWIHIAPLEYQTNVIELKELLRTILSDVIHQCALRRNQLFPPSMHQMELALDKFCMTINCTTRRNSIQNSMDQDCGCSARERTLLHNHFEKEINVIEMMLGKSLKWA